MGVGMGGPQGPGPSWFLAIAGQSWPVYNSGYFYNNPHITSNLTLMLYSRSQNNVNVVYCNYKETNSSYNVIAKRNSPQTLLIVGNIF